MKRRTRLTAFAFTALAFTSALASTPKPTAAQAPRSSRAWSKDFRDVLQQNILKFWIDHAIDREYGGMIGWLDREGNPVPPGTKSLVQQTRVVWTFAASYQRYPEPVYKEAATHTLKFLRDKMWDAKQGGFYWLVERDGTVKDDKKHLYGESFAIYGLAEYARVFNDARARKEALDLFELIDRKAHDNVNGGYREAYSVDWLPLKADPTIGGHGRKSMNTHIHLLESFTTLYKVTKDKRVRARVEELLGICANKIVDSQEGYARLFFADDWKPADGETSSYGHDIELSWLMTEAAEALGKPRDPGILRASSALVEHTLRDGFDHEHGGVYDEGPYRGPAKSKRMVWWVEAEALVGLLNAYQLTGKQEYRNHFEQQARYVFDNFVDHQYGEWFRYVDANGAPSGNKTDEWKAPYHDSRACLEVIQRLEHLR